MVEDGVAGPARRHSRYRITALGGVRLHAIFDRIDREARGMNRHVQGILRVIWLPLLVGILVRMVLIPITLDEDLVGYTETAASMMYGQPLYAYSFEYPPLWGMYLDIVGHFVALFVSPTAWLATNQSLQTLHTSSPYVLASPYVVNLAFVVVEKSSLLLFDVASGVIIYALAVHLTGEKQVGRTAFALWFLNPLVIIASSAHGAFDVVPTFFVLAALALCLNRNYLYSGLSIAVGTLFKIFPVLFVPLLIAMIWRDSRLRVTQVSRSLALFAIGIVVPSLLVLAGPGLLTGFLSSVTTGVRGQEQAYGGAGFWGLFTVPAFHGLAASLSRDPTLSIIGLGCFAFAIIVTMGHCVATGRGGRSGSDPAWLYAAAVTTCCAFLITIVVQPQYAIWILPFMLLLSLSHRTFKAMYVILTVVPLATYFLLLGGPLLLFLPMSYHFHLFTIQTYESSIVFWGPRELTIEPWFFVPEALALITVLTVGTWKVMDVRRVPHLQSRRNAEL